MNKLANNLIPNLFKSRTILLDILHGRGFNINDYANSSINEIGKLYANKQLDMVMEDGHNKPHGNPEIDEDGVRSPSGL